jgi:ABC-2 type transport system ATP-binding protein
VGLTGPVTRTRYRRLSGGEKQRVGLALALVGRPDVAILDEPTSGMDVEARAVTRDLIRGLRDAGVAVLLTSHDLADVERLADRIAILDRGRLVAIGSPDELSGAGAPILRFRLTAVLAEPDVAALASRLGGAVEADGGPGRYRVAGRPPDPALVAALADWCAERGVRILELRTGGGTLEERYLELTGADADADAGEDAGEDDP